MALRLALLLSAVLSAAQGTNVAHVTHTGYPVSCPPLDNLAWGEAGIFKPTSETAP
jgi:hypothetical protein